MLQSRCPLFLQQRFPVLTRSDWTPPLCPSLRCHLTLLTPTACFLLSSQGDENGGEADGVKKEGGEGALPGGWQTFFDQFRRPYYFHAATNTTQWTAPAGARRLERQCAIRRLWRLALIQLTGRSTAPGRCNGCSHSDRLRSVLSRCRCHARDSAADASAHPGTYSARGRARCSG